MSSKRLATFLLFLSGVAMIGLGETIAFLILSGYTQGLPRVEAWTLGGILAMLYTAFIGSGIWLARAKGGGEHMHAHHELPTKDKNEIMELIYTEFEPSKFNPKHLRPVAITRVQGTEFFPQHNNTYEGFFLDVQYADGRYELWFAVDLAASLADDRWFLEKIR